MNLLKSKKKIKKNKKNKLFKIHLFLQIFHKKKISHPYKFKNL